MGHVVGITNHQGENLKFPKPVKVTATIESWLK